MFEWSWKAKILKNCNREVFQFFLFYFLLLGVEASLQTAILEDHNNHRRDAGLQLLTWSNSLAATAQKFADEVLKDDMDCKGLEHSESGSMYRASDSGENLFMSGGGSSPKTPDDLGKDASNLWFSEIKDYKYGGEKKSFDSCVDWIKVGHFTQIMWAKTTTVGCGSATCSDNTQYVVCQYSPGGNLQGAAMFKDENFDKLRKKTKSIKKCSSADIAAPVWAAGGLVLTYLMKASLF